ncbi:hypothetical protein [Aquibaculum sediminis]|uniref:hypothetical protein n=1 Tax=Aquibaculum sediminis TaxID=3231907 RepID=UPI0034547202
MAFGLKRTDCQRVAQAKLEDATLLLNSSRYSNAYYLAGYAVEIGLKACIARQISADTIPDKSFIDATYRHEFKKLVGVAGLSNELREYQDKSPIFGANWAIVSEWRPEKRYESIDRYSAQAIIQAIADPNEGVFLWIKKFW